MAAGGSDTGRVAAAGVAVGGSSLVVNPATRERQERGDRTARGLDEYPPKGDPRSSRRQPGLPTSQADPGCQPRETTVACSTKAERASTARTGGGTATSTVPAASSVHMRTDPRLGAAPQEADALARPFETSRRERKRDGRSLGSLWSRGRVCGGR